LQGRYLLRRAFRTPILGCRQHRNKPMLQGRNRGGNLYGRPVRRRRDTSAESWRRLPGAWDGVVLQSLHACGLASGAVKIHWRDISGAVARGPAGVSRSSGDAFHSVCGLRRSRCMAAVEKPSRDLVDRHCGGLCFDDGDLRFRIISPGSAGSIAGRVLLILKNA